MKHSNVSGAVYVGLSLMYIVVLFFFLNYWGVIETSEARYAEIGREMYLTGDWIHPRLLQIYHFHKPPFTYWLTAVGYALFGINSFGARFFLQVSILMQLILLFRIVTILFKDNRLAFTTVVIYASMYLVLITTRSLTTDSYLNTFVLLATMSWLSWKTTGKHTWLYLLSLAFALGFMTKGPLVFIVPIAIFVGLNKLVPKQKVSYHHLFASFLFLVLGLWWYAYLVYENNEFLSYFLYRQTYERAVHADVFSRREPFWYYLIYLPLLLMPWSVVYIASIFKKQFQNAIVNRINIFWIAIPLMFFSLASSKLVLYVVPICPGVAIATAFALRDSHYEIRNERIVFFYFIIQWFVLLLIKLIDNSIFETSVMMVVAVVAIASLIAIKMLKSTTSQSRIIVYTACSTILLLTYAAFFLSENELKVNSTKPIAEWINNNGLATRKILVYNKLLPSLEFNTGKNITSIYAGDRYLKREVNFEKNLQWKNSLLNVDDNKRLMTLLNDSTIVVVKGELHEKDLWMKSHFRNRHVEGKWVVYY